MTTYGTAGVCDVLQHIRTVSGRRLDQAQAVGGFLQKWPAVYQAGSDELEAHAELDGEPTQAWRQRAVGHLIKIAELPNTDPKIAREAVRLLLEFRISSHECELWKDAIPKVMERPEAWAELLAFVGAEKMDVKQLSEWTLWSAQNMQQRHPLAGELIEAIPSASRARMVEAGMILGDLGLMAEIAGKSGHPESLHELWAMWPELGWSKIEHASRILEEHLTQAELLRKNIGEQIMWSEDIDQMFKKSMWTIQIHVLQCLEPVLLDNHCMALNTLAERHQMDLPAEWKARGQRLKIQDEIQGSSISGMPRKM